MLAFLGEPDAGEAHLRRALELAENGEETARAYLHLGELRRVRGDHAGALSAMVDGERHAAQLGLRGSFGHFMYVNAADDLVRLGRWDEAAERLEEARRMDLSRTAAALRRATAGQLAALRGELETARRELDAAAGEGLPSEFLTPLAVARATLALIDGRSKRGARARGRRARGRAGSALHAAAVFARRCAPRRSRRVRAGASSRARPRARRRPARRARRAARRDARHARRARAPGARRRRALARRRHARARPLGGGGGRVRGARRAVSRRVRAAGAARGDAARGRRAPAPLRALAAAHAVASALGARPLREAAEALARRARLEPAAAAAAAAPPEDDGAGLTARELEVLRLLADGLTNREIAGRLFISQKTVGAHMAHIYGKLDVHSRVEAAGRAQQLGVLQRPG